MGRILAIDYGRKRTGLAVTDSLKIIANALQTVDTATLKEFLQKYFLQEDVEAIVVGKPYTKNFETNDIEKDIEQFIVWLNEKFPTKSIHRIDERFTSKMATQAILASGVNKKTRQQKEIVDRVSATIILQTYLEMQP
ncbi:MAG: Holliday junction resolvase RuvX [Chitinophagales bacterium]|nr:Holliday junction resolvase RuvX [Chitinophagales bacterium]OJV25726.1 MAG: Holliday junction DNA helicase RuvA [Bacteroidetes bacterium 37-13]